MQGVYCVLCMCLVSCVLCVYHVCPPIYSTPQVYYFGGPDTVGICEQGGRSFKLYNTDCQFIADIKLDDLHGKGWQNKQRNDSRIPGRASTRGSKARGATGSIAGRKGGGAGTIAPDTVLCGEHIPQLGSYVVSSSNLQVRRGKEKKEAVVRGCCSGVAATNHFYNDDGGGSGMVRTSC